jgi:ABC-2 type transport system ATP-binding protein
MIEEMVQATVATTAIPRDFRSSDSVVEMVGLSKRYPVRRTWAETMLHPHRRRYVLAVDGVSCTVAKGELFGLLGPNGAGKTTIFKILSTLIEPDGGEAMVAGHDLRTEPHRVRSVLTPVIADERSLNWRLSATENLRLFATLYGLKGQTRRHRIAELLEIVGLDDAENKIVGAFSSGMKQRLLLARALIATPRVLLLDEPTRSLDPIAARNFRAFLREEIVGRQGSTVLLATHSGEEALDFCDRVGVLDRGRMIAVGTPAELTRRAAGYRYRVWTRMPDHLAFRHLEYTPWVSRITRIQDSDGWGVVDLSLTGDGDEPANVLDSLVQGGARVRRFERVQLPLAELIEDLVRSSGAGGYDA